MVWRLQRLKGTAYKQGLGWIWSNEVMCTRPVKLTKRKFSLHWLTTLKELLICNNLQKALNGMWLKKSHNLRQIILNNSFSPHWQSKGRRWGIILKIANQWKDTVNVTTRSFSSSSFLQASLSRSSRPHPSANRDMGLQNSRDSSQISAITLNENFSAVTVKTQKLESVRLSLLFTISFSLL